MSGNVRNMKPLRASKGGRKSKYTLPQVNERQAGIRDKKLHKIRVILCMSMLCLFRSDIDFVCLVLQQCPPHSQLLGTLCIYSLSRVKKQKLLSDRMMEKWGKYGLDLWWTVSSNYLLLKLEMRQIQCKRWTSACLLGAAVRVLMFAHLSGCLCVNKDHYVFDIGHLCCQLQFSHYLT